MEKLEGLPWRAGFAFESYGLKIGVRVNEPALLDEMRQRLPPQSRPIPSGRVQLLYSLLAASPSKAANVRRYHLLYADQGRLARTFELPLAMDAMKEHVQLWIAELSRRWLFVHAGVVGWRGRAIVLPGKSQSGKSTLVEALVRAGATYYSDEYAVLDGKGCVRPFPRAIVLRDERANRRELPIAEERVGRQSLPVGLVAIARYRDGATWRPRRVAPGRGVLTLLGNTVSVRHQPAKTLGTLRRCVDGSVVVGGTRGEADATADSLLNFLEKAYGSESAR